ncbi:MAG: pantoate--beta-alanine ligase [Actinomycetes bacterium]
MTLPTVLNTVTELNDWCTESEAPIAAVFTMGALHAGHAELVTYAKSHTPSGTRVVATIFVNPTQFNSSIDLAQYPSALEDDLEILAGVGVDAVFVPSVSEMYPNGLVIDSPIEPGLAGEILEGKSRPGHFSGMLTVVRRLLEITHADYSFFGEKDFQQLTLVKEMVKQLTLPIEIIGVPTVRNEFGLALSSRNSRLSPLALQKAFDILHAMTLVADAFSNGAEKAEALALGRKYLSDNDFIDLDYLEICAENLLDQPNTTNARVFIAVTIAGVRLIDNLKIAK